MIEHWDIVAVITDLLPVERKIFLVSVYIPCSQKNTRDRATQQLLRRLNLIWAAFLEEKSNIPELELIITGDFNRWDSLWGGNQVINHLRQGEAEELISFIADLGLQYVLPRGTITYSAL